MVDTYLKWVLLGLIILSLAVTTISSIRAQVREKKKSGKSLDAMDKFEIVLSGVVDGVKSIERASNKIVGDSGFKAGGLKLDSVLDITKQLCNENGIAFAENSWQPVIELIVSIMNEQTKSMVKTDENNIIEGVNT